MTQLSERNANCRDAYSLSYSELRVLVALAALHRAHGDALTNSVAIAEVTGVLQSTVRIALANLAKRLLVEVHGSKVDRWHRVTRLGLARVAG